MKVYLLLTLMIALVPSLSKAGIQASVTSGPAPLSVHFSTDIADSDDTNQPFHDHQYTWAFGDSSGVWGTSGKPKSYGTGPEAAHVYTTPGVYTVSLIVRDSTGVVDTGSETITVLSQDTVFPGGLTTCISTGYDFTGCPDGATHITTSSLSALGSYTDAGERVLLRRGDTWDLTTDITYNNNNGPVYIGAFGECSAQDAIGICNNAPHINISGEETRFLNPDKKKNWTIADISFSAPVGEGYAVMGGTRIQNFLVYRIKTVGFWSPVLFTNYRQSDIDYHDNNAIVSSHLAGSSSFIVFVGSERLSIMGNIIQDSSNSHACRVWHAYKGVISHNIISGSSAWLHTLKLHGPAPYPAIPTDYPANAMVGDFATTGAGGLREFSKSIVVSDNIFGGGGPWLVSIGPQDTYKDERLSDIIFERNKIVSDYGKTGMASAQMGVMLAGRYITARNNIVDGSNGSDFIGIQAWRRGVEWTPHWIRIYNNTLYTDSDTPLSGIYIDADTTGVEIKNNLMVGWETIIDDASLSASTLQNISGSSGYLLDPENIVPLSRNYQLERAAVDAVGSGVSVPVYDDFLVLPRYGAMDIGAFRATPRRLFSNVRVSAGVEP